MQIGMTYDMRSDYLAEGYSEDETAEFDRDSTIAAIENALAAMGHKPVRIGNLKSLVSRLAAGERWDLVFNIAEGLYGFGRESQIPALLDAYRIPYVFSDPLVLALTLHKGMTKHVVRDLGIATPDFAVVKSVADLAGLNLPYPLFAKPVAEGTGKGVNATSKINNPKELARICGELLTTYRQPVLVETFLPGREFTVGIVGNGAAAHSIGIMEVVLLEKAEAEIYSYHNKENCEELVEYQVPNDPEAKLAIEVALASWHALGCQDAGRVDLRSDANGYPNFIEVNPLAGLHPEHSDLCIIATKYGISYQKLLNEIVGAALVRTGLSQKAG
ncbi:MAG: D-alanine--D-alanine ligase [Proteobacteria bacterium]|nr:D-alanine--D-alanine ligase [Pseudomonadota bacterium]MBU1714474.1 D-alanine--D-alanine ligase [Pseudomonadota bacterium]